MWNWRRGLLALLAVSSLLVACGGSDDDEDDHAPQLVVFGDSLSDSGTYAVTTIAAAGGGKYTINGEGVQIWTEIVAARTGFAAPCAAQTGLESNPAAVPPFPPPAPITNHAGCYSYAQGGARVTHPVGPYNKALLAFGDTGGNLGQITDPVLNQIGRHLLAVEHRFGRDDLVLVLAGANDVFMNLATVGVSTTPEQALAAMEVAGNELVDYVRVQMIGKGARRIVVVTVPDVSLTPFAFAEADPTRALINGMVQTFNGRLVAGLTGVPEVLLVDAYTASQQQYNEPEEWGLTNVTVPACNLTLATLGSLVCSNATLVVSATAAEKFLYADGVHPTPKGHELLAELVLTAMLGKGWR